MEMKKLTPGQLKKINTMISMQHIGKEAKAAMIAGFTGGRAESSGELWFHEANLVIQHLEASDPDREKIKKMKGKILYYVHQMGWYVPGVIINGKPKLDMRHVDDWCIKFGHGHKKFDQYTVKELPMLVSQMEAAYNSFINSF
jgi:hypothetical protein